MNKRLNNLSVCLSIYLFVFAIGYLDYVTGPEIGFSLFYLIPIILTGWFRYEKKISLVLVPGFCAAVWLLADIYSGHHYSEPWIPYWNMVTRLGMFTVISVALSRLRAANAHERTLARIDPLTGVYNTRYFAELVSNEISRATRYSETFSFAYLDVDNFKNVNDTFGHEQGDQLLKTLTKVIKDNIRNIDTIARFGGDEFGILFPRTDAGQSHAVMSKIYSVFRNNITIQWKVTLSAGVTTYMTPPNSLDEMVRAADALMYKAKKEGKDQAEYLLVSEST
jgi:diguanylate cyclase (GGDEF)-like protein